MTKLIGFLVCLCAYPIFWLILGRSITIGVFILHVVVVPLLYTYSHWFRQFVVFFNIVQWPLYINYDDPDKYGIKGTRNLSVKFQSKVDNCSIKLGIWHILPKSSYERLKDKFGSDDKVELHQLMDDDLKHSTKPIVMYCHGNSFSRSADHRIRLYNVLQNLDYHIISFDYRGYGDSTPVMPSESGVVEDALVVYDWIHSSIEKVSDKPPVYIWGHSLGTGVSSKLVGNLSKLSSLYLDRHTPLPLPRYLILEAAFNNMMDVSELYIFSQLVRWLPYFNRAFIQSYKSSDLTFTSDEHLAKCPDLPVLMLHAKDDAVVPFAVGLKLYKAVMLSRQSSGAACKLHVYEGYDRLGHANVCTAKDLPDVLKNFTADLH